MQEEKAQKPITQKQQLNVPIAEITPHDSLTGLPDQTYFKEQVRLFCEYAKEHNKSFAVILLNIDGFKYINDALGIQAGDDLIVEVAQRLLTNLDDKHMIFRYIGDVFSVIVNSPYIDEYEKTAAEIIRMFRQTFKIGIYELDVTISMGISLYSEDYNNFDKIIRNADAALYWAKNEGNNRYKFYSPDINIQNYKQFQLRNDLRRGLEGEQFTVVYQPIVGLKNSTILAAEALIRWEHPEWGMLPPGEFIPLAEETGLIIDMGKWVLRRVCQDYMQWQEAELPDIKVSINFSGIQFLEEGFIKNIKSILDEFKLNPNFLIVEITESVLIYKMDKVIEKLKELQSLGMQIALDDFGTGYSSLAYLHSFNIDILKIGDLFTKGMLKDESSNIITRTVIGMARELKIKLVAEGIENWDQLYMLRDLNCYAGQGYIYGKPLSQVEFRNILKSRKCKPIVLNTSEVKPKKERRKFYRIKFYNYLESSLTVVNIRGKSINVGNTKVLIRDIGPGGLCFLSNIMLPVDVDIVLKFTTNILDKELTLYGNTIWMDETEGELFKYGIEYIIDENDRADLIKTLNKVQIKMKSNILFAEGSFVSGSPSNYFKLMDSAMF